MNGESPRSLLTRRRMLKIAAAGTASVGVGTLLAACAPSATTASPTPAAATPAATPSPGATPTKALEKVSLMTAFLHSSTDVPWFLARERGYFASEGLDVDIIPGQGSVTTARVVGAGSATFGVVDGGVVIRSAGTGIPIRAVLGVFQSSPQAVMVRRDSGMTKPKDLEGKTLGAGHGSAVANLFPGWMRVNGADPDKVTIRFVQPQTEITLFIQGQLDGVMAFLTGTPQEIEAAGVDAVPIKYSDFGFNVPGNSLVANALTIRDRPKLVRSFVTAAAKGLADSLKEPEAALEALLKAVPDLAPERATLAKSVPVNATLARTKRTEGKPIGWMHQEDWREAIDILKVYGGLQQVPKVEEVVVNFIPES